MALADKALPFGMRQIRLTPLSADGLTPGAAVTLPVARTLSFGESEDTEELRGDDQIWAQHGSGPVVDWDLEAGGISLEAYAVMAGGAIITSGITPNIKKTYTKLSTDVRPYFKAEGRAVSDNGGDFHVLIYRAKVTDSLEGELSDNSFWLTSATGQGLPSLEVAHANKVYDFVHNETAVVIP